MLEDSISLILRGVKETQIRLVAVSVWNFVSEMIFLVNMPTNLRLCHSLSRGAVRAHLASTRSHFSVVVWVGHAVINKRETTPCSSYRRTWTTWVEAAASAAAAAAPSRMPSASGRCCWCRFASLRRRTTSTSTRSCSSTHSLIFFSLPAVRHGDCKDRWDTSEADDMVAADMDRSHTLEKYLNRGAGHRNWEGAINAFNSGFGLQKITKIQSDEGLVKRWLRMCPFQLKAEERDSSRPWGCLLREDHKLLGTISRDVIHFQYMILRWRHKENPLLLLQKSLILVRQNPSLVLQLRRHGRQLRRAKRRHCCPKAKYWTVELIPNCIL